jgi:hypothetical protein
MLFLACVFADVAMFLTPWPLNLYVALPTLPLLFFGFILLTISVLRDWRPWRNLAAQAKPLAFVFLLLTAGALVWMNIRPRVFTVPHPFRDDPIVKVTQHGWPFPLASRQDITEFYVPQFGDRSYGHETEYPRMQKEFSREGFVDSFFNWPLNVLHWFLILLGVLLICEWARRPTSYNDSPL